MTLGQCYDKVRKLLNYYSAGGTPLPAREGDLWPRAAALLDTAQTEFSRMRPKLASAVLAQTRLPNLLPDTAPVYVGDSAVEISAAGSQSLTFSTNGPLDLRVTQIFRGSPMELAQIVCPAGVTAVYDISYKPMAGGGPVTLTFSGGPAYVWDLAAYEKRYADGEAIPPYGEFRWQPLPEGCVRVDGLSLCPVIGDVQPDFRNYRLRGREIGLPWDFEGTVTLVYEGAPAPITEDSPEDMVLDVDDAAAEGMAFFAAAYLVAEENRSLFELFMGVYRNMLVRAHPDPEVRAQLNSLYFQRTRGDLK